MSFHPRIDYATFHRSERRLAEEGGSFAYTPDNRSRFDEIVARYPEEQRRSAVLPALYLVQEQVGYVTGSAMRYVADLLEITAADVEDVVSFYDVLYETGRAVRAAGLPYAVVRIERGRAGDGSDLSRPGHRAWGNRFHWHLHARRSGVSRSMRSRARRHGQ